MNTLELSGIWWLPESPDSTISGTLSFDGSNHARLKLIGSFREINDILASPARGFAPPIILGVAVSGQRVTLYQCMQVNRTINLSGYDLQTSSFEARAVFVGAHLTTTEELMFSKFAIRYDRLGDWAQLSGFTMSLESGEAGRMSRFTLKYELPDEYCVVLDGFEVAFPATFHWGGNQVDQPEIRQSLFVEVRPNAPATFSAFLNPYFYHVQNFLSLGIGQPVYPVEVRATLPVSVSEGQTPHTHPQQLQVYYAHNRSGASDAQVQPWDMLFSLRDLGTFYESCLQQWFLKASDLKPVYDLYFATLYGSGVYLESRFLNFSQALETYHRRRIGGTYLDEAQFAEVRAALRGALAGFEMEEGPRAAYERKLKYLNEVSLRKRIKEIVTSCGEPASMLISDGNAFAHRVTNTRNYLTHYDPELQAQAATGEDLYIPAEQLKFLLELCFLKELGLPESKRAELVGDNRRYQHLQQMITTPSL